MRYSIYFDSTELPTETRARLIKDAGFDSTFLWWSKSDGKNIERIACARNVGLEIETAHAEFRGINDMWLDTPEATEFFDYFIRTIKEAKAFGIPTLIIHLSSGDTPPEMCELGFERFLRLVDTAEKNGVVLAFENLRKVAYLDAMLAKTNSEAAKFCFDIGHENIYNGGSGVLEKHCDRIAAFHIHDNHATSDEHLLPFDGNINWDVAFKRIKPYLDKLPLTLEVSAKDKYDHMSFYELAMERAKKIVSD